MKKKTKKKNEDQLKGNMKFKITAKPGERESPHPARGMLVGSKMSEGVNDPHIFKAVFMAGGPCSGKSFVAQKLLGGTGLRPVNSDEVYEYLLKRRRSYSRTVMTLFIPWAKRLEVLLKI